MGLFSLNLKMSEKIAQAVKISGGRVFYVGGYVRDKIMHRPSKDIDIEVHGTTPKTLVNILSTLGEPLEMGASFGILGLRHYSLDIVLPRSIETGEIAPFIGTKEAARRRDFTMNALMMDVLTGEVLDFFGGLDDIERKLIRHVDDETFLVDRLRVIRAARFSAVLGFDVDENTRALCSSADISNLAVERVFGELENALTKSPEPSRFFTELERMNQISFWFPEIRNVISNLTPPPDKSDTSPKTNPSASLTLSTSPNLGEASVKRSETEGLFNILDKAALFRKKSSFKTAFMLASLCHDLPETDTARFISRLTNDRHINEYAVNISKLATQELSLQTLDASVCPDDLALLHEVITGQPGSQLLSLYHSRMNQPYVTGADLLREGVTPGPLVGKALKHVHNLRLSGVPKELQLSEAMRFIGSEKK